MEFEAMYTGRRSGGGTTTTLKEHDYIGMSEASEASSGTSCSPAVPDLNESATALRLGPPKCDHEVRAPPLQQRNSAIVEEFRKAQAMKAQQQVQQQQQQVKAVVPMYKAFQAPYNVFAAAAAAGVKGYGVKRGFSETVVGDVKVQTTTSSWMHGPSYSGGGQARTTRPAHVLDAGDSSSKGKKNEAAAAEQPPSPAPGQTVGWPPVRSFVRNNAPVKPTPPPPTSTTDSPSVQENETPSSSASAKSLFVKIYMDGVPFGRKVDLKTNNRYEKLYSALEEMFHQFINAGHYSGSQTATSSTKSHFVSPSSNSSSSRSRKLNFLDGSEYVLIYEDHEGDFMLVGDVPWDLFVNTVKRLRIMKGSEEVNLAPKTADPVRTQPAVG